MPLIRPGVRRLFSLRLRREGTRPVDIDAEIALHLELRVQQLQQTGLSSNDARNEALRRFGSPETARVRLRVAANHRDNRMNMREQVASLALDARYALRGLMRERWLTAFVAITLGLGIGVNAAMYGVVDRLLLRGPEYVRDVSRLQNVYITTQEPGMAPNTNNSFGYVTYNLLRQNAPRIRVATWQYSDKGILYGRGLNAEQWSTGQATADLFPILGVTPMLGRFYSEEEDKPGAPHMVVVLGFSVWKREFNSDSAIVGKPIQLGDRTYTVIGVARKGFTGTGLSPVDVWMPMSIRSGNNNQNFATAWNSTWLNLVARLEPGVTVEQANAEITAVYRRGYGGHDESMKAATLSLAPISYARDGTETPEYRISRWLIGVCLVVLIVACSNVANLLLVRALRRRREVAVRLALGVSRARLLRLFLVESLILAFIGAISGLFVAFLTGSFMRHVLLPNIEWTSSPVDVRVLVFSLAIAVIVGVAIGLLPAWRATRPDLTAALKSGIRDGGGNQSRMRSTLTIAQSALSVVLLVGAGLFVRSLSQVRAQDLGIQTNRVLTATLKWPSLSMIGDTASREVESKRQEATYPLLLARIRQLADVEHASLTVGLPFQSAIGVSLRVPGWDSLPRLKSGDPTISAITDDYFNTTGGRIIRGRAFATTDHEGTEPVTIVSETMAKTLWPKGNAIGQCLMIGDDSLPPCFKVVGVSTDAHRFRLREEPAMHYYVPFGQHEKVGIGGTTLLVRPRGAPNAMLMAVRRTAQGVDPTVRFVYAEPLQNAVDPQIRPWQLGANVFSLMGVLALCVAAIGLYSVMSYLVAHRRQELGIRMALGANSRDVLTLILRSGVGTAGAGVLLGIIASLLGGRFIEPLLFETSSHDVLVYAIVIVTLLGVAVLASVVPALRARHVSPIEALRTE
ncbi:MAG: ABC transporter permease [Gemmatimonas sp.]